MDSEQRQEDREAAKRGGWYIIKGVPVAVILTLAGTLIPQTITLVWFLASLSGKVELVQDKQVEFGVKQDKTDAKLDALTAVVQNGTVPNAVNARRIDDLERRAGQMDTALVQLSARVNENERKIIAETLRGRAARER